MLLIASDPSTITSQHLTEPTVLPPEILDLILEELRLSGKIDALRNCALANRLLCALSQRHIFDRVAINLEYDELRCSSSETTTPYTVCAADELLAVLRHAPHLANYIHNLTIESNALYPYIPDGYDHWLAVDASLPPLLLALKNLRAFHIPHLSRDRTQAKVIEKFSRPTIFAAMPSTLETLVLDLHNVPARYIQSCHGLKRLSIISLNTADSLRPPLLKPPPLHLHQLEIDMLSTDDCSDMLRSVFFEPRGITKFTFSCAFGHAGIVSQLGLYMPSAQYLNIKVKALSTFARYGLETNVELRPCRLGVPNLGTFRSLTSLTLCASLFALYFSDPTDDIGFLSNPLPWIVDLVALLRRDTLEELVLTLTFLTWAGRKVPDVALRHLQGHWVALRSIVCEHQPRAVLYVNLRGLEDLEIDIAEEGIRAANFSTCIIHSTRNLIWAVPRQTQV